MNPQTLNRYTYVNNNPVNFVDPSGHSWKKWLGKIVGVIAGIATTIITGGNFMLGFQVYNLVDGAYTAATTGNWGGFAGALAGGIIGGAIGFGWADKIAGALGEKAFTFGGGFLMGAAEFGAAGFGSAFGGALGSGASIGDSFKAGAIGFGVGALVGGIVQGTYNAGMQSFAHGHSAEDTFRAAVENKSPAETLRIINAIKNPDAKAAIIFKLQESGFNFNNQNQLVANLPAGKSGDWLASAQVRENTTLTIDLQDAPTINGRLSNPVKIKVFKAGEGEITEFTAIYSNASRTFKFVSVVGTNQRLNNALTRRTISFEQFFNAGK